ASMVPKDVLRMEASESGIDECWSISLMRILQAWTDTRRAASRNGPEARPRCTEGRAQAQQCKARCGCTESAVVVVWPNTSKKEGRGGKSSSPMLERECNAQFSKAARGHPPRFRL